MWAPAASCFGLPRLGRDVISHDISHDDVPGKRATLAGDCRDPRPHGHRAEGERRRVRPPTATQDLLHVPAILVEAMDRPARQVIDAQLEGAADAARDVVQSPQGTWWHRRAGMEALVSRLLA